MGSEINDVSDLNSSTLKSVVSVDNVQSVSGETVPADPQVLATSTLRRKFTKAYKLKILTAYDACGNALERGALLRREGIYHARISSWRKQLGVCDGGKKAAAKTPRIDHMAREIEQLKKKLAQAQAVIDLQKKVSELLGTHILSHDSNEVS
jgi:transposase-like protein